MWRDTKLLVGRYRPAGNMTNAGYFERNVNPLIESRSTIPDLGFNQKILNPLLFFVTAFLAKAFSALVSQLYKLYYYSINIFCQMKTLIVDSESNKENKRVPLTGSKMKNYHLMGANIGAPMTSHNMDMRAFSCNMGMGAFMNNMTMGSSSSGRSGSVETRAINGRTIEKTTVIENGVTTVTKKEF